MSDKSNASIDGFNAQAATWGGSGFIPRARDHAAEMAAGSPWSRCGYTSEADPLRSVMLTVPGPEFDTIDDPNAMLMLEPVELSRLRDQQQAIAAFYASQGVEVHLLHARRPPPNLIFLRDTFSITPQGAIVARLAPQQRAGEERWASLGLAQAAIPILHTMRGDAVFEGADALWLNPHRVLLGLGRRTNPAAQAQLSMLLAEQDVEVMPVHLPPGTQHLLGVVNFIDHDLAAIDRDKAAPELYRALQDAGVFLIECLPDLELRVRRGMNFVCLGPRRLVMPAACPQMRARFEDEGVEVHELDVSEYLKAGGGLACLTGILRRD